MASLDNTRRELLSIVVPCFNEEGNLEKVILAITAAAKRHGIVPEIVIVDDGSTDGTRGLAAGLAEANPDIKTIYSEQNLGIGSAFWRGVESSTNEFVVMLPGDGENDPDEVLRYLPLLKDVDLVVPFVVNKSVRNLFRRLISKSYRLIINLCFGTDFNYTNGTIIYSRVALLTLDRPTPGFFFQTELLIRLSRNYLFAEVPHFLVGRNLGKSKALRIRSVFRVAYAFLVLFIEMHVVRSKGRRDVLEDLPPATNTYRRYVASRSKGSVEQNTRKS